MPKPSKPTTPPDDNAIPELDHVVAMPAPAPATPPPNLDLFDSGLDAEALRDAISDRLAKEIDAALAELHEEFAASLRRQVEARLRDRLPEIIDSVLRAPQATGDQPE